MQKHLEIYAQERSISFGIQDQENHLKILNEWIGAHLGWWYHILNFLLSRWYPELELDKLLANIVSLDNTDPEVRKKHYAELSKYLINDEAIVVPVFSSTTKAFVNNRVKKWDITPGSNFGLFDVELTADSPVK